MCSYRYSLPYISNSYIYRYLSVGLHATTRYSYSIYLDCRNPGRTRTPNYAACQPLALPRTCSYKYSRTCMCTSMPHMPLRDHAADFIGSCHVTSCAIVCCACVQYDSLRSSDAPPMSHVTPCTLLTHTISPWRGIDPPWLLT